MIFDSVKWNAFIANPDANVLQADPAFSFASAFVKITQVNTPHYILRL